jgi:hypothetical protein
VLTGGGGLDRHAAARGWASAVHQLWTLVHGGPTDSVGGALVAVTRGAVAEGSRWWRYRARRGEAQATSVMCA